MCQPTELYRDALEVFIFEGATAKHSSFNARLTT
jgi:hypothetical protein